jgi:Na+-transporting methylmalonyl-CoA/oxaloacetate decarboxylase gamma subunit
MGRNDVNFHFDVQNIIDGQGIDIAITGMVIVFFALSVISLFIAALPRILTVVAQKWPESEDRHGPAPSQTVLSAAPSDEMVAAIAITLHRRKGVA